MSCCHRHASRGGVAEWVACRIVSKRDEGLDSGRGIHFAFLNLKLLNLFRVFLMTETHQICAPLQELLQELRPIRYSLGHLIAAAMIGARTHGRVTRRNQVIQKCVCKRSMIHGTANHANHCWIAWPKFHESKPGLHWQRTRKLVLFNHHEPKLFKKIFRLKLCIWGLFEVLNTNIISTLYRKAISVGLR